MMRKIILIGALFLGFQSAFAGQETGVIRQFDLVAKSVSGKLVRGHVKTKASQCAVDVREYEDRFVLVLKTDAYIYDTGFVVLKNQLPLNEDSSFSSENTKLDGYYFSPNVFGRKGELVKFYKRYYSNSSFSEYGGEFKLEVAADLSQIISASIKLDDPYGDDGAISCEF